MPEPSKTAAQASGAFPLGKLEAELVRKRREKAGADGPAVGVAISGGGVRSATVGLGFLQALAAKNLLHRFDYLSTVSGGGYIGSFWGSLFVDPKVRGSRDGGSGGRNPAAVAEVLKNPRSPALKWLRENGRYLSPNGAGDSLLAAAALVRNWIAVHVTFDLLVLAVLFVLVLARKGVAASGAWSALPWISEALRSPALLAAAAALVAWSMPAGWAYWIVRSHEPRDRGRSAALLAVAALLASAALAAAGMKPRMVWVALAVAFAGTFILWRAAGGSNRDEERMARNRLSLWLRNGLIAIAAALAIAAIDAAGFAVAKLTAPKLAAFIGSATALLVAAGSTAQRVIKVFWGERKDVRVKLPMAVLAGLAAAVVGGAFLVALSAIAYAIGDGRGFVWLGVACVVAFFAAWFAGQGFAFLNDSSHAALYSGRLARAYLGASNPDRERDEAMRITELQPGDDVPWSEYRPHEAGGPLHIINVTVNETIEGRSQVEQRDRKGIGLAIGPAGMSAGVSHHAAWSDLATRKTLQPVSPKEGEFRVFEAPKPKQGQAPVSIEPEQYSLGTWVAVSGAAVSTGLGSRTSRGLSILCGLFNLRLGRWWNSGVDPKWRARTAGRFQLDYKTGSVFTRAFPVQAYFLTELLARFRGPGQSHWYLTDGGHYENTAAYELIRRRVPMIVVLDNGEDCNYEFHDLANLARKVRTDFCAEIEFLPERAWQLIDPTARGSFGTLTTIRGERADAGKAATGMPLNRAHATLARVRYPDGAGESLLLILKPALTGREPLDVLEYGSAHASFPHQSTADQYFDEAQWESYRRLGEFVAESVFTEMSAPAEGWSPRTLNPEPLLAALDASQPPPDSAEQRRFAS